MKSMEQITIEYIDQCYSENRFNNIEKIVIFEYCDYLYEEIDFDSIDKHFSDIIDGVIEYMSNIKWIRAVDLFNMDEEDRFEIYKIIKYYKEGE